MSLKKRMVAIVLAICLLLALGMVQATSAAPDDDTFEYTAEGNRIFEIRDGAVITLYAYEVFCLTSPFMNSETYTALSYEVVFSECYYEGWKDVDIFRSLHDDRPNEYVPQTYWYFDTCGNLPGKVIVSFKLEMENKNAATFEERYVVLFEGITMTFILEVPNEPNDTTLALNHGALTVPIGQPELPEDEVQLKAYVNGEETTDVIWESAEPSIVSVDSEGKLTGLTPGVTVVTAYTPDRRASASCDIHVGYEEQMKALVLAIITNEPQKSIGSKPSGNLREFGAKLKDSRVWMEDPKWNDVNVSLRKIVRDVCGEFEVIEYIESTSENKGFQALCAQDSRNGQTYIVFGGTDLFGGEGDAETNYLYMVNNELNIHFDKAWEFYNKHSADTDNCVLVGYSMGGSLAAYVSMLSGEKAYTFNGTNGLVLDDTYMAYGPDSGPPDYKKAQSSEIFNSFHGADLWDFHNYIARGGGSALFSNYNLDKYKHSFHTEERRAVSVGTHSYYSLFHFEPESNTLLFNQLEEYGGAAEYNFQIGNVMFGTSGDERLNVALSPGLTKLELAELALIPYLGSSISSTAAALSTVFGKSWGYGGDGNDTIRTGLQSDVLAGGPGVNELYGGGGNDLYVITDGSSCYIEDPSGNDEIRLTGAFDYAWHEFLDPRSLIIYLSNGEQIGINLNRNFFIPGTMKLTDQYGAMILDITKWLNLPMYTDITTLAVARNSGTGMFTLLSAASVSNNPIIAFVVEGDAVLTVLDKNDRQVAYAATGGEQQKGDENGFYYPSEDGIVAYMPDTGYVLQITGNGRVSVSGVVYDDKAELCGIYSVTDVDLSGGQTLLASTDSGEMLLQSLTGGSAPLDVTFEIPILSMQLSEEDGLNVKVGESCSLSLEITPSDATQEKLWFSSDPDILTVDNNGMITGVADGTALVYVYSGNLQEHDVLMLTVGTANTGADAKATTNTMLIIGLSTAGFVLISIGIAGVIFFTKRKKKQ